MTVLEKKFTDGNITLLGRHLVSSRIARFGRNNYFCGFIRLLCGGLGLRFNFLLHAGRRLALYLEQSIRKDVEIAMRRFLLIVSVFLVYTTLKAIQLAPGNAPLAVLGSVALFFLMLGGMFIYRAKTSVFERGWFRALAWTGSLS